MAPTNGRKKAGNGGAWHQNRSRAQRLTRKQRADFLEHVHGGMDRKDAAEVVGSTGTTFRTLCRTDPLFEADFEEARQAGRKPISEKLRRTLLQRALDPEQRSSRTLHNALMLYDDEYRTIFTRSRLELTGKDGGPVEHKLFDPTKLSDEDLEQLDRLLAQAAPEE